MVKETFQFETYIYVNSFYVDEGNYSIDKQVAFELASSKIGIEKATKEAANDFRKITGEDVKIVSVKHLEFDSNNLSHAVSYYQVVVETENDTMQKFIDEQFGHGDSTAEYLYYTE